ncbi:MAG: deoxyhypusine synthase family protein [Aigarchaeota archaeon]|nr:deoxyhypusine synthase family protein [Aigarchaeota archaeon]MDW8092942.1 deoxyhypusine synthase family protein [Nitrososphaerota archaeon]
MCDSSDPSPLSYLRQRLRAIDIGSKSVSQLLNEMADTGFQGRRLGEIVDVWSDMLSGRDVVIMLGYAGSMSTTGQWKIIKWLIERRFIDVLVSTGANVSEDILDAMGYGYWKGSPNVNDWELRKMRILRFYDVFALERDYIEIEKKIAQFMMDLEIDRPISSAEFLHLFGRWLDGRKIDGIVTSAWRAKVPVFVPAIVDSGYGMAYLYMRYHRPERKLLIDQFKDFEQLVRIKSRFSKSGVIYLGGGVPKDFIQLSAVAVDTLEGGDLTTVRPHNYAIQITTDSPHWGGLSGASFEEAESWGKESPEGRNVQCSCDITIALPLVVHALAERVKTRESVPDLSWVFKDVAEL